MNESSDQQLLRDYAKHGSELAFTKLVRRHVDLVYSAAFRMLRDAHLAEDVTQSAFVALAQSAVQLSDRLVLSGWLHRTAQNIASKSVRSDVRRRVREQEVVAMNELLSTQPDAAWEHIEPYLDEALGELSEPDRDALFLRYFERKSAREMAHAFGTTEDAAQKRVSRAVERLREFFAKRGVTASASGLVVVITANAVQAAPVGLAATISTAAALGGTAITPTATAIAAKAIAMTTLQKALIAATLAVVAGTGIYEARQAGSLREQIQTLRQQQAPLTEQTAQLRSDNESLSNQLVRANRGPSLSSDRLRELLRLRGEVGALRQRQRELEQTLAATRSKAPQLAGQPTSSAAAPPNGPAPFQVQLVVGEPGENSEPMTNNAGGGTLQLLKTPLLDHTAIRSVNVTKNPSSGAQEIDVEFSEEGKELFAAVTKENINKRLAIVLNGQLYSAPVIRSEITGGRAQITGNFTETEAKELAARINDAIRSQ